MITKKTFQKENEMKKVKLEIKKNYSKFRSELIRFIEQINYNDAYILSLKMETYLLKISVEHSDLPNIDDVLQFNVLMSKLKDSCTYKNQRNCNEKLEIVDNFFFEKIH